MSEATEAELRYRPLKQLYSQVQLRKKYRETKMEKAKKPNCVFIRLEPHPKHCKIQGRICVNIIAPAIYQMSYLIGSLRDRLLKQKIGLSTQQGIFLFVKKKLMTSFKEKIGQFWEKNKEDDDILYIEFSDEAPF